MPSRPRSPLTYLLSCLAILGSLLVPTQSHQQVDADVEVEWAEKDLAMPFSFDPETDSDIVSKAVKLQLSITDPDLNNVTSSAETVVLTPLDDDDDLTIYIEDADGDVLISGDDITDCSGFDSASFTETGANTGIFKKIFDVAGNGCGLDPKELVDAKLIVDYRGETDSATFNAYSAKIETSEKEISAGLEVTITVTDEDQNKDANTVEEIKVKVEPTGLDAVFVTLDETGKDTGKFSAKLKVGKDFQIVEDGALVENVAVTYYDPAASDGSDQEKTLILSPEKESAVLTISPSDNITPWTEIEVSLADKDLDKDPDKKDIIDIPVLTIYTDNDDIDDDEISLGDQGLRMEETDENSGEFVLTIDLEMADESNHAFEVSHDRLQIPARPGDMVVISYEDKDHEEDEDDSVELVMEVESFDPEIKTDKDEYLPGDTVTVTISDADANIDPDVKDSLDFRAYTDKEIFGEELSAIETTTNSGNFTFKLGIVEEEESDAIKAQVGDILFIEYDDPLPADYSKRNPDRIFTIQVPIGKPIPMSENTEAETPVTKDFEGNKLENVTAGHQVWLSTEIENNLEVDKAFVVLLEVRDPDGVTIFLEWQTAMVGPNGTVEVAIPWVPDTNGTYEIRTFVLSSLTNSPEVLSTVKQSQVIVS